MRDFLKHDWILTSLWIFFPIALIAGVAWDSTKSPTDIQMFLGATNNILFFSMSAFIFTLAKLYLPGWKEDQRFVLAWAALLSLSMGTLLSIEMLPMTTSYWIVLLVLGGMMLRMRALTRNNTPIQHALIFYISIAFTLGLCLAVAAHLLGPLPSSHTYLFVDGFANVRTFGETALVAWLIAMAWFFKTNSKLAVLVMVIAGALMFWSGTRAAWVGAGATLIVLTLASRNWKAGLLCVGLMASSIGASLLIHTPGSEYGIARAETLARDVGAVRTPGYTTTQTGDIKPNQSGTGSTRVALWTWGFEKTLERPVFGHGIMRMYYTERPKKLMFAHLHNLPLDMAFWFGWPTALLLLAAMLWGWFGLVVAQWKNHPEAGMWLALSTGLCVTSLFSGLMIFPLTLFITALALCAGPIMRKQV